VLPDRPPDDPEPEDPDEPGGPEELEEGPAFPEEPCPPGLPPPLRFSKKLVAISSKRSGSDNAVTLGVPLASRRAMS